MMQETDRPRKCYTNAANISKSNGKDKPMYTDNENSIISYFLPGPKEDKAKKASTEIIQQLQRDFKHVFTRIRCFDGAFQSQVKPDSKSYQVPLKYMAYALQNPFKQELE